jgi:hypothetical protein
LQQLAGGGERFAIGDAVGAADAFQMGQRRNKIFADPFDQPGAGFAVAPGFDLVGQNGARRIGEDKFVSGVFSKPGLQPAQRSAGADADDDGVDIAVQLL